MVAPTTNELGKLLASYLSTSNDALAVNFRKHYSPTNSATLLQKTKAKRINAAVTEATFTYRHAPKHASRIVTCRKIRGKEFAEFVCCRCYHNN